MQTRNTITSATNSRSSSCRRGFSLLELIIMIAVIGVLVGVVSSMVSNEAIASNQAKLQSDVAGLNHMVALYVAHGGNLAGLTTPQSVLDKMKRYRPQAQWQQYVGVASGKLLDVRLQAQMTTQADSSNNPRAFWDRTKQRFVMSQASGSGVSGFYLDNTLAGADYGSETRTNSVVTYNASSMGWVWGTTLANPAASYLNPQTFTPTTPSGGFNPNDPASMSSNSGGGGSGGSGGGSGGGVGSGGGPPTLALLPAPLIAPGGGTFAYGSFPTSVTISSGGAPPNVSTLMYSINGGAWQAYDGSNIPVTPAMNIQAQNQTTLPAQYTTSTINAQTYYRLTSGFSGTDVANWGNVNGGANLVTNIQNSGTTSTLQSGNTKLDLGNGQYLDAGVQNSVSFTPTSFASITPNTWFNFGGMQILNGTTFYNSDATGATLSVNLSMSQPAVNFTAHVDLGFVSTPNSSDPLASADIVQLLNPTTDLAVTIDGVQYTMQLQWVSLDPSSSIVQGNNLLVFEGAKAAVELQARFVSNQ